MRSKSPIPTLAILCLLAACTTVSLVRYDLHGPEPLRRVHQCVTEQVVDHGFYITETRRDDGVIKAERATDRREGLFSNVVRDYIEVLIFERQAGGSTVQYLAASVSGDSGNPREPSPEVTDLAREIAAECAGIDVPESLAQQAEAGSVVARLTPPGATVVASLSRQTFYPIRPSCTAWHDLPNEDLGYPLSATAARSQGFKPSTDPGCEIG